MMLRRWILSLALLVVPLFAYADWAADRDASPGFVKITTLATVIDEAVPFVYVKLSDLPASFHTYMDDAGDTTGRTIRVSTGDGATELACYVVGINTTTDTGGLFFLATGISASDNVYYRIYSGNAALTLPTAAASNELVFASYAGAYMPGMTTEDLTSGNRDLTAVSSPGTVASGYEGITAATYGGTNYHYATAAVTNWPVTIEGIAYTTSSTLNQQAINLSCSTSSTSLIGCQFSGGLTNDPYRGVSIGAGGSASIPGINNYTTSTNHFVAVSRGANVGTTSAYIDSSSASDSTTLNTPTAFDRFSIGGGIDSSGSVLRLAGRVTVALLSASVRSADYVSTMQDNWLGDLYSVGVWETNWETARNGSAGYVTVTTLASSVDEAVPFCVTYLSDMPADFWTAMDTASDTDGKTIRVSTSDGTTELPCVPIGVNTTTDTGCLIFLGTGMSASVDVDYRIYVGNSVLAMPPATSGEQAVFASYAGVYFPGVDTRDWTSGGRTLTAVNTPGTAASGYEGITAATYNGSSQYHSYSSTPPITTPPLSLETLFYAANTTHSAAILSLSNNTVAGERSQITVLGASGLGDRVGAAVQHNGGTDAGAETSTSFSATTWDYAAGTRSGTGTTGTTIAYRAGGSAGTSGLPTSSPLGYNRIGIGARISSTVAAYFNGNIAVALLSSSVRSADYVSTMQDNWAGTMYSAGAWTPASSTCNSGSTGWVLLTANSQTTTANADWANLADSLVDDMNTTDVSLDDGGVFLSETLRFYDMDFDTATIPTGADSYTVTIRIKKDFQSGSARDITDEVVQYVDETGTQIGDNLAITASSWPSSPASVDYSVTGHSFDGTEFDADSGFVIQADGGNTNGATLTEVYVAWIKVDWTCPSTIETASGFFGLED